MDDKGYIARQTAISKRSLKLDNRESTLIYLYFLLAIKLLESRLALPY
jgi:hypothetical protein